ncbi:MAG: Ig-like domain-containing protein, partial [Clostridia bacterium]|nr:Ig-like domain-containing protein [Clostridia bacterium]
MLKGKKWLIGVCSMLLAFGITACSGSDDNSSSSIPDTSVPDSSSSVEPSVEPAVTLSSETLNMNLFEKSTLTASLTELTGDVVWSTSDASVATVENGVVHALKVGTVTITATVGEYSDTCAVTIARGELKPTFDAMSAVSVIVGHTYDLDATLTLNDEAFELATITYASEGEYLTVTPEGKVTAVKEGSQKVTVTATYEGETLATAEVTVNVIEVGTIETGIDMNVLSLKVTNLNGDSVTQYSLAGFKATVNGLVVNKTISYTVEDEDVVKVEDGKIVAVAAGETVVTAKFTADSNKEYTTEITVTVGKELVAQDVEFKVKASEEKTANTGTSEIDFTGKDLDIKVSDITKVLCNGAEITFSTNGNVLTLTNAPAGEQTYVFETAKVDVELQGFIYQRVISTKAELLAFGANYNGQYGYTVLANDIDMEGETLALETGAWLRCTFDGQGYTISNLRTTQGFLGNFNEKGALKNLQLVNIVLERPETDAKGEIGLLGQCLCGTVENVLVLGYIKNAKENQPLLAGNDYSGTVYNNVIIVASTDQPTLAVSGSGFNYSQGAGATGAGVYYVTSQKIQVKPSNATKLEAAAYTTVQEFIQKADFSTFGEPWNGTTMNMSDFQDNLAQFDVAFDGTIAADSTITVDTTLFDAVVSVKEETTGIVATGRSLQIVENGRYTIVVKSAMYSTIEKEVDLIVATTEEISTTETYVETKGGNTTLNLSKLSKTIGGVTDVSVNGKAVTQSVSDNVLTFANAQTGAVTLTIYSEADNKNYVLTVNVADLIIDNADEFTAWAKNMGSAKYVVLAGNITLDAGTVLQTSSGFSGYFNGQGYTVSNAFFKWGIFANGRIKPGAVMKNVNFDNLIMYQYGLFGSYIEGGVIENFNATVNMAANYTYIDGW